jgi:hypothetical protein
MVGTTDRLGHSATGPNKFLTWAFENTTIEDQICEKLGLPRHLAAEVGRKTS